MTAGPPCSPGRTRGAVGLPPAPSPSRELRLSRSPPLPSVPRSVSLPSHTVTQSPGSPRCPSSFSSAWETGLLRGGPSPALTKPSPASAGGEGGCGGSSRCPQSRSRLARLVRHVRTLAHASSR